MKVCSFSMNLVRQEVDLFLYFLLLILLLLVRIDPYRQSYQGLLYNLTVDLEISKIISVKANQIFGGEATFRQGKN